MLHLTNIDVGQNHVLPLNRQFLVRHAVAPFGMAVAKTQHEELIFRLIDDRAAQVRTLDADDRARRVARARPPLDRHRTIGAFEKVRGGRAIGRPYGAPIPRLAGGVVIAMKEETAALEVGRRPDPMKLKRRGGNHLLRIARADWPHAPRSVARADKTVNAPPFAVHLDPAGVAPVLGQTGQIHRGARPLTADKTRLLNRKRPAHKQDIGPEPLLGRVDAKPQLVERLDDIDRDRADRQVHALHVQPAAGVQIGLDPIPHQAKAGVGDVQVRIDPERHGEKVIALCAITVEEIPIIEIAIGPAVGDGFAGLMDRIVVALG